MYCLSKFCFLCLNNDKNLISVNTLDSDKKTILEKLLYILDDLVFVNSRDTNICKFCCDILRVSFEFKKKCLQNNKVFLGYVRKLSEYSRVYARTSVNLNDNFTPNTPKNAATVIDLTCSDDEDEEQYEDEVNSVNINYLIERDIIETLTTDNVESKTNNELPKNDNTTNNATNTNEPKNNLTETNLTQNGSQLAQGPTKPVEDNTKTDKSTEENKILESKINELLKIYTEQIKQKLEQQNAAQITLNNNSTNPVNDITSQNMDANIFESENNFVDSLFDEETDVPIIVVKTEAPDIMELIASPVLSPLPSAVSSPVPSPVPSPIPSQVSSQVPTPVSSSMQRQVPKQLTSQVPSSRSSQVPSSISSQVSSSIPSPVPSLIPRPEPSCSNMEEDRHTSLEEIHPQVLPTLESLETISSGSESESEDEFSRYLQRNKSGDIRLNENYKNWSRSVRRKTIYVPLEHIKQNDVKPEMKKFRQIMFKRQKLDEQQKNQPKTTNFLRKYLSEPIQIDEDSKSSIDIDENLISEEDQRNYQVLRDSILSQENIDLETTPQEITYQEATDQETISSNENTTQEADIESLILQKNTEYNTKRKLARENRKQQLLREKEMRQNQAPERLKPIKDSLIDKKISELISEPFVTPVETEVDFEAEIGSSKIIYVEQYPELSKMLKKPETIIQKTASILRKCNSILKKPASVLKTDNNLANTDTNLNKLDSNLKTNDTLKDSDYVPNNLENPDSNLKSEDLILSYTTPNDVVEREHCYFKKPTQIVIRRKRKAFQFSPKRKKVKVNQQNIGWWRYRCHICYLKFKEMNELNFHVLTKHQGKQLYKCEHCERVYTAQSSLQRHYREIHPRPRTAVESDEDKTAFSANLLPKKCTVYKCKYCERVYSVFSALQQHCKEEHDKLCELNDSEKYLSSEPVDCISYSIFDPKKYQPITNSESDLQLAIINLE